MAEAFVLSPNSSLKRAKSLPVWTGCEGLAGPDFENAIIDQLRKIRKETRDNIEALITQFKELADNRPGVKVLVANDATRAVQIIEQITPDKRICVNKSGTIKEIRPYLERAHFVVEEVYEREYPEKEAEELKSWEFPDIPATVIWKTFALEKISVNHRRQASKFKDITGVLGVNAASCADGATYFLQHFSNIGKILKQSKRIIFLVGLEKLVKTAEDALLQAMCMGVFGFKSRIMDLALARSGGGTDFWDQLPEVKGADEIYYILLDNGRRSRYVDDFRDLMLCISCRSCRQNCPTYRFYGARDSRSPREYLSGYLAGVRSSLDGCAYCKNCVVKCPLDINIAQMISRSREEKAAKLHFFSKEIMITRTEDLDRMANWGTPWSNILVKSKTVRKGAEFALGVAHQRSFPHFHRQTFRGWFKSRKKLKSSKKVGFFHGCYINYNEVGLGKALVRILEKCGYEVMLPPQHCCHTPKISVGDLERAQKGIAFNVSSLYDKVVSRGYPVLITCPSGASALKEDYPWIMRDSRTRQVADNVVDFATFFLELIRSGELVFDSGKTAISGGYHMPCHTKSGPNPDSTLELLKKIPGVEVAFIDRGCCGMSGSFGLKKKNYQKSLEIGADLFGALRETDIECGITECGACKMQMVHGSGKNVLHPLQLVQMAQRSNA